MRGELARWNFEREKRMSTFFTAYLCETTRQSTLHTYLYLQRHGLCVVCIAMEVDRHFALPGVVIPFFPDPAQHDGRQFSKEGPIKCFQEEGVAHENQNRHLRQKSIGIKRASFQNKKIAGERAQDKKETAAAQHGKDTPTSGISRASPSLLVAAFPLTFLHPLPRFITALVGLTESGVGRSRKARARNRENPMMDIPSPWKGT